MNKVARCPTNNVTMLDKIANGEAQVKGLGVRAMFDEPLVISVNWKF